MLNKFSLLLMVCWSAIASADRTELDQLVALGVPPRIERLLNFRDQYMGAEFVTDVYYCKGRPVTDSEACGRKERINTSRTIKIIPHDYLIYIDMKVPSNKRRFWLINTKERTVEVLLVAHGVNSAEKKNTPNATKFSNIRDTRQTSLGIYMVGDIYRMGGHGPSLRLYGLEKSNDQAYIRDVVMHGANYAKQSFIDHIKAKLGIATERLGESWGCPAIDPEVAKRIVPKLAKGALLLIDHEDGMDQALTGNPVNLSTTIPLPKPRPEGAPKRIEFQVVKEAPAAIETASPVVEAPTPNSSAR